MKSIVAPLAVLGSFVGAVYAQTALIINTPIPAPVQCQPTLLTWGGGQEPYFISIVDPNDKTTTLVDFGQLSNTSLTWVDLLPAGTDMLLTIKDNTGLSQSSAAFTVGTGGSASCLTTTSSSGSQSGSSTGSAPKSTSTSTTVVSTTTTSTAVTTPVTSPSATSTSPKASSTATLLSHSGSASASAPGTSQTPSGSGANSIPAAAAAAVVGAVFAALF
ncbi:hypothetical protein B0H16DRAFT_1491393 [Mycena metata]|uniref:Uncharacterized protein n=1 Tax=Mycena metata TaxID=1033252 RepID=A0AAD7J488_9AGAR|nr:hypothetical protein B0H16DRAFT_1539700 [Mycena metata]KAJ7784114.1 hypothetical protein B0H16DRAFT_1491393 [Mycena metata]